MSAGIIRRMHPATKARSAQTVNGETRESRHTCGKIPTLMQWRVFRMTGWISLFTIAACALNAVNLESRSLWLDEGFTLMRVFGAWSDLARNVVYWNGVYTIDTNPQAYFALLKLWSLGAGRSEFALELFSFFGAVLFVPLCFALGRRAFGARAGLLAALFAAASPLLAWYAVELRMYSWVVNLAVFAALALLRLLERPTPGGAAIWIFICSVALLTHYSFVGMILAHALLAAVFLMRGRRLNAPLWSIGVVVAALAAVGVIIDAPALWERFRSGAEYSYAFKPLYDVVGSISSGVLFGVNQTDPSGGWLSWIFVSLWCVMAVLVVAGASSRERGVVDRRGLVMVVCVAASVLVWYGLSMVKPNFSGVRHLMLTLPMILVVLAGGLDHLLRRFSGWKSPVAAVAGFPVLLLLAANVHGMAGVMLPGEEKQDDWRSVARTIRMEWRPGDLVIANSGTPREVVQGYLAALPVRVISVVGIDLSEVKQAQRIWYLNTGAVDDSPDRGLDWVRALSRQQAFRFAGRTNTLELLLLAHDGALDALPPGVNAVASIDAVEDGIAAWQMLPPNPYASAPNLQLRLFWRRGSGERSERTLSFRLRSGETSMLDVVLPSRLPNPAERWASGKYVVADYTVRLPIGMPPLQYEMEIVSYDAVTGEIRQSVRAPLTAEQVQCCVRQVSWQPDNRPSTSQEVITYRPAQDVSRRRGLVMNEALIAVEHAGTVLPGRSLFVATTWQDGGGAWTQGLTLESLAGREIASVSDAPGMDAASWPMNGPMNGPMRTTQMLAVPDDASAGWHRISAWRNRGRGRERTYVGLVRIVDYPIAPPNEREIGTRLDARAGEFTLLGTSFDAPPTPGRTSTMFTYWRVEGTPARDGVIFVHVFGPDGGLIVQEDHPPDNGARSTRTFRAGAGHRERSTFTLPKAMSPGSYTIYVGIYDRDDLERWPATQNGAAARNNLIVAGTFTVEP